jgi:hypothetical protein
LIFIHSLFFITERQLKKKYGDNQNRLCAHQNLRNNWIGNITKLLVNLFEETKNEEKEKQQCGESHARTIHANVENFQCALAGVSSEVITLHIHAQRRRREREKVGKSIDESRTLSTPTWIHSSVLYWKIFFKLMQFVKNIFYYVFLVSSKKTCDSNFLKASQIFFMSYRQIFCIDFYGTPEKTSKSTRRAFCFALQKYFPQLFYDLISSQKFLSKKRHSYVRNMACRIFTFST